MSTSSTESYSLSEFVDVFELPQDVLVTEGFSGHNDNTAIGTGDILGLLRVKTVCYLSGLTFQDKHKVNIPLDCQQKVEIPARLYSRDGPVETVKEFVDHCIRHVKYVRVLRSESLPNGEVIKAGEILEILFIDSTDDTLVAVDGQECEVRLPMSCSAGFSLLDYREDYLLSELLSKDLLPMSVRFVGSVPAKIRETFIEKDHSHNLGVFYLEKRVLERRGVEVTFYEGNGSTLCFFLDDTDISVSLLETNKPSGHSRSGKNTEGNQSLFGNSSEHRRVCGSESDDEEHRTGKTKFSLKESVLSLSKSLSTSRLYRSMRLPKLRRWKSSISKLFGEDRGAAAEDSVIHEKASHVPSPSPDITSKESDAAEYADKSLPSLPHCDPAVPETTQTYEEVQGRQSVAASSSRFSPKRPLSPHFLPASSSCTYEEVSQTSEHVYEEFHVPKRRVAIPFPRSPTRSFSPHVLPTAPPTSTESDAHHAKNNNQSEDIYDDVNVHKPGEENFLHHTLTPSFLPQSAPPTDTSKKINNPNKPPPSSTGPHSVGNVYQDPEEHKPVPPNFPPTLAHAHKYPKKPSPSSLSTKGPAPAVSERKRKQTVDTCTKLHERPQIASVAPSDLPKRDSFSDIPLDLSGLSGRDVVSLLERMKLGQYAEKFLAEQVDGSLLEDLDVDVLIDHFGLTAYHAKKLSEFVKGWRPQFSSTTTDDGAYETMVA